MATYLGSKYQEHDMNNKLIEGGIAALKGLADTGNFIFKKAKPVAKCTFRGVEYICKFMEFQLSENQGNKNVNDNENKNVNENKNKNVHENKNENNVKPNNSFVLIDNNNYPSEPYVDFPSLDSIIKMQNNNYNNNQNYGDINYNNQNNNINNNQNNKYK